MIDHFLLSRFSWKVTVFACSVPSIAVAVGRVVYWKLWRLWELDSPRYLVSKHLTDEASRVLDLMADINDTDLPEGDLDSQLEMSKSYLDDDWRKSFPILLAAIAVVVFAQNIGILGQYTWIARITQKNGIPAVMLEHAQIWLFIAVVVSFFMTPILTEKFGRRKPLMVNFSGSIFSAITFIVVKEPLSFYICTTLAAFFAAGTFAIPILIVIEAFPTPIRASSLGVIYAANKLSQLLAYDFLFEFPKKITNAYALLAIPVGCFALALLLTARVIRETELDHLHDSL